MYSFVSLERKRNRKKKLSENEIGKLGQWTERESLLGRRKKLPSQLCSLMKENGTQENTKCKKVYHTKKRKKIVPGVSQINKLIPEEVNFSLTEFQFAFKCIHEREGGRESDVNKRVEFYSKNQLVFKKMMTKRRRG